MNKLLGLLLVAAVVAAAADGADTETSKPAAKKTDKPAAGSFKPVMINRQTRYLNVPYRTDITYPDGGRAHRIRFPRPIDNRVEALVGKPRIFRWLPRRKQFFEPEYHAEHNFLHPQPTRFDRREVQYVIPRRFRRAVASLARSLYGGELPSFPAMPESARRAVEQSAAFRLEFPGRPRIPRSVTSRAVAWSHGSGRRNSYGVVEYPKFGVGPRASLEKLDFALGRLSTLNGALRSAEARVAAAQAASIKVDRQIAALTRVRAHISKLATQIATLEAKLGKDKTVQAEIRKVIEFDPRTGRPALGSDLIQGDWQGEVIRFQQ
jgi:hypothetical protein